MQYTVYQVSAAPDEGHLALALIQHDSAARVQFNASHASLQIVSSLPKGEIVGLLTQAGFSVAPADLVKTTGSDCCGGCDG